MMSQKRKIGFDDRSLKQTRLNICLRRRGGIISKYCITRCCIKEKKRVKGKVKNCIKRLEKKSLHVNSSSTVACGAKT